MCVHIVCSRARARTHARMRARKDTAPTCWHNAMHACSMHVTLHTGNAYSSAWGNICMYTCGYASVHMDISMTIVICIHIGRHVTMATHTHALIPIWLYHYL